MGVGVGMFFWLSRPNFVVVQPEGGLPPGVRVLRIQLKKPLERELEGAPFAVEPEVPVVGWRRVSQEEGLLFLGVSLSAGQTYTVRALPRSGLAGQVKVRTRPMEVALVPAAWWGPHNEPALLLQANGPIHSQNFPPDYLPREGGTRLPVQWVSLSSREALLLIQKNVRKAEVPSGRQSGWIIEGGTVEWPSNPTFAIQEALLEEAEEGSRIRIRFNRWVEGLSNLESYFHLEGEIPFRWAARAVEVYLYPARLPEGSFKLEVKAGFPGQGPTLERTERFVLSPLRETELRWAHPFVHFVPVGTPLLFRSDGSPTLRIALWRILPQNVRFFLRDRGERLWFDYKAEQAEEWIWGSERLPMEVYGELVQEMEVSPTVLPKVVRGGQSWRAIGHDLTPGLYFVEIKGRSWWPLQTWFAVGEYGLMARAGKGSLTVWAVRYENMEPLSGVRIEAWGPAGQVLGRGETGEKGEVTLTLPKAVGVEGVWAEWKGQPNYLSLRGLGPGRWGFETQGLDPAPEDLLVYLQPGRTLFRPGESLTVAGFVRTADIRYPKDLKRIWGRFVDPRGSVRWEGSLSVDPQGGWTWSYDLPLSAPTGEYRLQVYRDPDKNTLLATLPFQVEFFRPNRLEVGIDAQSEMDRLKGQVSVTFLYGAVARNLPGELSVTARPASPQGAHAQGYVWTVSVPDSFLRRLATQESFTLDSKGQWSFVQRLPAGVGLLDYTLLARVRDDEGRPNLRSRHLTVATQPFLVGQKALPAYVGADRTLTVELRALEANSFRPAREPVVVQVEVVRRTYEEVVVEEPWGSWDWRWVPVSEERVFRSKVEMQGGQGSFTFTPPHGELEIRVWAPGQRYPTVQKIEAWSWTSTSVLRGDPEGWVEILPQAERYAVGQKARLLLKLPAPGRVLVSVERGRVLHSQWLAPQGLTAEVEVPLASDWMPGVYVHAVVLHPGSEVPFRVSRGLLYLPVEDPKRRLAPQLEVPERALPGSEVTVRVRGVPPGCRLVLAAVDQGLLALQQTDIGSPYDYFYQRRAHGLVVSEQFPYMLTWGTRAVGGDIGEAEEASLDREAREEGVALLWPDLKADKQGHIQVSCTLPTFTGRLRWRVYALMEEAFGMAEAHTLVAIPVVARVTLPFFLSEGDEVFLTLTLRNTTSQHQQGTWALSWAGQGIEVEPRQGSFALEVGGQQQRVLRLRATAPIGIVPVRLLVQGRVVQEREVRLRPATAPLREVQWDTLPPGETRVLPVPGQGFSPVGRRIQLVVTGERGLAELVGPLNELLTYPHGCGEQTTSGAFAVLMAGQWLNALTGLSPDTVCPFVEAGIARLQQFQTEDGGFAYWPGEPADAWLSVYVTHFLYEAKQAGYTTATLLLEKALAYQKERLAVGEVGSLTAAYRALVLAQALPASEVKKAFPSVAQVEQQTQGLSRLLWRAAFAQVKLPLPKASSLKNVYETSYELAEELESPVRNYALALYALSFVEKADNLLGWIPGLIERVRRAEGWLSTQETNWSLLALRRISARLSAGAVELTIGGASVRISGLSWGRSVDRHVGQPITLRNLGDKPVYIGFLVYGVPLTARPAQAQGLAISYSLVREGSRGPVSLADLEVGQRLRWVIEVRKTDDSPLPYRAQNIALTVPLPAGWQADNARLTPEAAADLIEGGLSLDYVDRREDRLLYYFTLEGEKGRIAVPVEVILGGRYRFPALSVLAMYRPNVYAHTAGGEVEVGKVE